jgi:predicted Fe-Mo cluster-binding NifX family protein
VAQADGVSKQPAIKAPKPAVVRSEEPDDEDVEVVEEPTKRKSKKAEAEPSIQSKLADVVSDWGEDD